MECWKITFESKLEAENGLKQMISLIKHRNKKTKNKKHVPKETYKCTECGKWHVTSS